MLAMVVAAIVAVERAILGEPVPPGADSGHWITTSFAYIGRPHPTDFRVQAGVDPPFLFLVIGGVVLALGNPLTVGYVVAGLLLLLYGLTSIHLARRFIRTPSGQVVFVACAVLNGTTTSMLFWGGYPNFLAFSTMNEAMLFLLAFVRSRSTTDGIAFFGFAALTFLTHSLTFAVFGSAALAGTILLLLQDRSLLEIWRSRGLWIGAALFLVLVGLYVGLTALAHVPHAGYLYTNPGTYLVDPLGAIFRPLHFAPAFFPAGPVVTLSNPATLVLLLGLGGAVFLGAAVVAWRAGRRVPRPLVLALGWLAAGLLLPAFGYLAHVDTDYPRFVYFLPLPIALAGVLLAERVVLGVPAESGTGPLALPPRRGPTRTEREAAWGATALLVVALFALVTVPTVATSESTFTTPSYDANFLSAVRYFNSGVAPGAVLTQSTEAERWVEALTTRNAYTASSTWLQFYYEEILDNDLSYWALNSEYVVTDDHAALEFSGPNATAFDAFPEYVPYLAGIEFPAARLSLGSLVVTERTGNGTAVALAEPRWPAMSFALDPDAPVAWATSAPTGFTFNETASLDGSGGATIALSVVPDAGTTLTAVGLALRSPVNARLAMAPGFDGFSYGGGTSFGFSVTGSEGALPTPATVAVAGTLSEAPNPAASYVTPPNNDSELVLDFPVTSGRFDLSIGLSAPGLSNPAVQLPPSFSTPGFLGQYGIRYALLETIPQNAATFALLEREMGFAPVYTNSEWQVLERGGS